RQILPSPDLLQYGGKPHGPGLALRGGALFQEQSRGIFLAEGVRFISVACGQSLFLFLQAAAGISADKRGEEARDPSEFRVYVFQKLCRFLPELGIGTVMALHGPDRAGVAGSERCGLYGEAFSDPFGLPHAALAAVQEHPDQAEEARPVDFEITAEGM